MDVVMLQLHHAQSICFLKSVCASRTEPHKLPEREFQTLEIIKNTSTSKMKWVELTSPKATHHEADWFLLHPGPRRSVGTPGARGDVGSTESTATWCSFQHVTIGLRPRQFPTVSRELFSHRCCHLAVEFVLFASVWSVKKMRTWMSLRTTSAHVVWCMCHFPNQWEHCKILF